MKREDSVVVDKNYQPEVGDALCNDNSMDYHRLVIVQNVYTLNKTSSRINRNYNDQLFKHLLLNKVIAKREIIWDQHKNDLKLFPNTQSNIENRDNMKYTYYLYLNDFKKYCRLYVSKYRYEPNKKINVITGKKTMITLNHSLCKNIVKLPLLNNNGDPTGEYTTHYNYCYDFSRTRSVPLSSVINQGFKYLGNIYRDFLMEDIQEVVKNNAN